MLGHLPRHVYVHEIKLYRDGKRLLDALVRLDSSATAIPMWLLIEAYQRARILTLDDHVRRRLGGREEMLGSENLKGRRLWEIDETFDPVDSTGTTIFFAPLIRRAYPNAILAFVLRDPRDVCLSIRYRKPFGAARSIDGWARAYVEQIEALKRYRDRCDVDLLRYEDWLRDTRGEYLRFLSRHGLAAPDELVDDAVFKHSAAAIRSGAVKTVGNLSRGVAGGWRRELTAADKEEIKPILDPVLVEFGYEQSTDW